MIASLVLSLTDFNLRPARGHEFIGLDNYVRMSPTHSSRKASWSTVGFALIAIPVTMLASLGFALLLNSPRLLGRGSFRTLFYMPIQIPLVASTIVWLGFLNSETGWLNGLSGVFGARDRTGSTTRTGSTRPWRSSACGASATSC